MKRPGLFAIAMGTLAGIGVFAAEQAYAGENDTLPKCSLGTLKGQYFGHAGNSGTIFPPAFGVTEPAVSDAAGFDIYKGDGTGTAHVTFTVNGVVVLDRAVGPFTYTLASDCSGTWNGGESTAVRHLCRVRRQRRAVYRYRPTGFANHGTEVRTGAPPER